MLFTLITIEVNAIACTRFLLIFICGLCLSLADTLKGIERIHSAVRTLLHYIIDTTAIFFFLYLPIAVDQAATRLLMFLLISVVYWIIIALSALIRSRIRLLMEEE